MRDTGSVQIIKKGGGHPAVMIAGVDADAWASEPKGTDVCTVRWRLATILSESAYSCTIAALLLSATAIVPAHYDSAQSFTTLITRPKQDEAESAYLCHFINSALGQRFFTQSQIGGAQKNVNVGTLRNMPVPLPAPSEQRAIAEALSDVDGLLGGLDRLIAKKRDLKQAAMQQLLTGQTRLPGFSTTLTPGVMADLLIPRVPRSAPTRTREVTFLGMEDVSEDGASFLWLRSAQPKRSSRAKNDHEPAVTVTACTR